MLPVGINLWELFERVATAVPQREAVVWRERRLTYAEVADQVVRLANVLADHGLGVQRERAVLTDWAAGQDTVGLYLLDGPPETPVCVAARSRRAVRAAPQTRDRDPEHP